MDLDTVWVKCLEKWKWISAQGMRGWGVYHLKAAWCESHGEVVKNDCFFCEYAVTHYQGGLAMMCDYCPARKVDAGFNCGDPDYSFTWEPKKFFEKLLELNERRLIDG